MHFRDIFLLAISAASTPVLSTPIHDTAKPRSIPSPLSPRQNNVVDDLKGKGRILVVNTTDYLDDNAKSLAIGCLNDIGRVVPQASGACNIFEYINGFVGTRRDPSKIFSSATGHNCTFHNKFQPENLDSYYGKESYAFYCGGTTPDQENYPGSVENEAFWTLNGFRFPYLGTGNINIQYYVKEPPQGRETSYDPSPLWLGYWGGHEMDGVKGQLRTLIVWDPVA